MAQNIINYGATANDGQGDPLRTAFIKTDENFSQIWAAGPVGSNVTITNNTVGVTNTNGNLILSPNGIGIIQTNNHIVPRANRTYDIGSANLTYRTVYANTATFQTLGLAGDLSVGGNLTVTGNTIQIGNITTETKTIQLANAASTANAADGSGVTVGANDNIATLLYSSTGNVWVTNIGISAVGNVTAPYFIGNGSQLTGIISSYGNSNVTTLLSNLGSNVIGGTGNITTTANISGGFILGNVAFATGMPAIYGNANVVANLAALGSNPISTTGNVTADYFFGNIQGLTGNITNLDSLNFAVENISALVGNNGVNIGAGGYNNLVVLPTDVLIQNVPLTVDTLIVNQIRSDDSSFVTIEDGLNVNGDVTADTVTTTGNITGNYFIGNGSHLTGIVVNTGNVTFNNQAVVGTGDQQGASGLYLAPGTQSVGNLQYLRVRGGDLPTHIHLDTGNNTYFDQYFGDDFKYVKLANTGNIVINTNNLVDASAQWTFGTDGNLNLPGATAGETIGTQGGYITVGNLLIGQGGALFNSNNDSWALYGNLSDPGATILIPSNADAGNGTPLYIESQQSNVEIRSGTETWNFGTDGRLTFPGTPRIDTDANNFEVQAAEAINFEANTVVNIYTDTSGTTKQWQFGDSGDLSVPGDVQFADGSIITDNLEATGDFGISTAANVGFIVYTNDGAHTWLFGDDGNLTLPDTTSVIANASITLEANSTGNITGLSVNGDADANLYAHGNVTIVSDSSNTTATWSFVNTGDIVLPNDVVIGDDGSNGLMLSVPTVTPGTYSDWTFDQSGNLNLPAGGHLVGTTADNSGFIAWAGNSSGDGLGYTTMGLIPDDTVVNSDQYIILDPTAPGHIHIRAGGTQDNSGADLFLGGENSYFRVASGANSAASVSANSYVWTYGTDGTFSLPAAESPGQYSEITSVGNSSGDGNGYATLQLKPDSNVGGDSYLIIDPTAPNHIHIRAGGAQDNSGAQLFLGGENSYFLVENGANSNVYVASNSNQWKFDTTGILTLPGEGVLQSLNDTVTLSSLNTTSGNANSVYLGSSGGLGFNDQEIGGNWLEIFRNGAEPEIRVPVGRGNLYIQTASGNTSYNWTFGDTGVLTVPGNITTTANITAGNVLTDAVESATDIYMFAGNGIVDIRATSNVVVKTDNAGHEWLFDNTGVLTVAGNIVMPSGSSLVGNGASPAPNISGFSSATFGEGVTATGNISGGNLITTGNVVGNVNGYAIGYRDIPQVSFTGNATIATGDAGKHFYSTQSSNYILTIANNASQGFQVGAAITVVNQGTGTITIAQGSGVTLYVAGNATSGNRSVATFGMATIMKVATDTWFINGTGVS